MEWGRAAIMSMSCGMSCGMSCRGSTGAAVTSSAMGGITAVDGVASLNMVAGGRAGGGVVAIASCVTSGRSSVLAPLSAALSAGCIASVVIGSCAEVEGSSLGNIIAGGALASAGVMDLVCDHFDRLVADEQCRCCDHAGSDEPGKGSAKDQGWFDCDLYRTLAGQEQETVFPEGTSACA